MTLELARLCSARSWAINALATDKKEVIIELDVSHLDMPAIYILSEIPAFVFGVYRNNGRDVCTTIFNKESGKLHFDLRWNHSATPPTYIQLVMEEWDFGRICAALKNKNGSTANDRCLAFRDHTTLDADLCYYGPVENSDSNSETK